MAYTAERDESTVVGISTFTQIVAAFLGLTALSLIALLTGFYHQQAQIIKNNTLDELNQMITPIIQKIGDHQISTIRQTQRTFALLSENLFDSAISDRARRSAVTKETLIQVLAETPYITNVTLYNEKGEPLVRLNNPSAINEKIGINPKDNGLTTENKAIKRAFNSIAGQRKQRNSTSRFSQITEPFVNQSGVLSVLHVSLHNTSPKNTSVIVIEHNLEYTLKTIQSLTLFKKNPLWVLSNSSKTILAPSNSDQYLNPIQFYDDIRNNSNSSFTSKQGVFYHRAIEYLTNSEPNNRTPIFQLVASLPNALILHDLRQTIQTLTLVSLLLFICIAAAGVNVTRKHLGALDQLAKEAKSITDNKSRHAIQIKSSGEIDSLISSFNTLIDTIKKNETLAETLEHTQKKYETINQQLIEKISTEDKILREKEAAVDASKAKSEFLAMMSHEIRTPMNGVIGITELLLSTNPTSEQKDLLDKMDYSGRLLLSVINDILDFSKIEAGKLVLEPECFSLEEAIKDVVSLLEVQARLKELTLTYTIDPDLPEWIISDSGRLGQILTNLIGNAIKFTSEGGITIHATRSSERLSHLDEDRDMLCVDVVDTGMGIPEEKQQTLFDAFSQVDNSSTRKIGGTGLGLAISQALVTLFQGNINVESEQGKGSTFRFSIPLIPGIAGSMNPSKRFVQRPDDLLDKKFYAHVLLVEDNKVNQAVATKMLKNLGCSYDIANNGEEAIEQINLVDYDLILMDLQMPVMDGITATKRVREVEQKNSEPRKIIVALTANAMKEDRQRCLAVGMDDYLSKPLKQKTLAHTLFEWIPDTAVNK